MLRLREGMLLYHGSFIPVPHIDLAKCKAGKDFGRGFHVTSSLDQARAFVPLSVRRQEGEHALPEHAKHGYVSTYAIRDCEGLKIYYFDDADAQWLHFVASNRRPELFGDIAALHLGDDIVAGKIANDRTARTLQLYISEAYGVPGSPEADSIAIATLLPDRLEDQFCFRTAEAIARLDYVGSERYDFD